MHISVSAAHAAATPVASGKSVSARVVGGTPSTDNATTQMDYHAQAAGLVTQETAQVQSEQPQKASLQHTDSAPECLDLVQQVLDDSSQQAFDTQWQSSGLDALSATLEAVFPALPMPQCEQFAQWMEGLRNGDVTPESLVSTLHTSLQVSGVAVPSSVLVTLEGIFRQVAEGSLNMSEVAQAINVLGRQSRHFALESFSRQFSEGVSTHSYLQHQPQGAVSLQQHVQAQNQPQSLVHSIGDVSARVDISPLLQDMQPERVAQPLNILPASDLAAAVNEMTIDRVLVSGSGLHQPQVRPAPQVPGAVSVDAMTQLEASVDISQPEWGRELVDQLRARLRFNRQDSIQTAHVRLDPPELGKLEITLRMEGDKVNVHIAAAHPQLREALFTHADRLRLDIEQSQLQLVDVSVSSGAQQQGHRQQQNESHQHRSVVENPLNESTTFSSPATSDMGRYASVV